MSRIFNSYSLRITQWGNISICCIWNNTDIKTRLARLLIPILTDCSDWDRISVSYRKLACTACTPNFDQWSKQVTAIRFHLPWWMPGCQWVSNVRGSLGLESQYGYCWLYCQSLRIFHARMLYGPATAVHTLDLLSPFVTHRRKMFDPLPWCVTSFMDGPLDK